MLIRSKIIRAKGTRVQFGKGRDQVEYHFKPQDPKRPLDDHVCDITDKEHIARLLSITEGYEVHDSEVASRVKTAPPPPKPEKPAVAAQGNPSAYGAMDKDALIKAVTERTGKAPHPTTKREKLVARLQALDKSTQ